MGVFSDGRVGSLIENSIGPELATAFNDAGKSVVSSTEVRWNFTWQGLPARVVLGGFGFSTGAVDGNVTSFTFRIDGQTIYSLTGINIGRSFIADLVHVSNGAGLLGLLYSGDDTFNLSRAGTAYALYGANGNDTFNFAGNLTPDDIVVGGAGQDTLSLGGDYTLSMTATTMSDIELLRLAPGGSYDLGFSDGNVASGSLLTINAASLGTGDSLVLDGSFETNGQFAVNAGAGSDRIIGGALGDLLNGSAGADTLTGGPGADTLHGGPGTDVLRGGRGADTLSGQNGHDTMSGGSGADRFLFEQSGASHSDTITDFSRAQGDRIHLEGSAFPALGPTTGALVASQYRLGAAAQDADDRIVYNPATGRLYYDSDGSGAAAKILVAILASDPTLMAADIVVI